MKLTKTWLSYIIWGLFSIVFFTNIGIAAIEIHQTNNMSDFLIPMIIMYGGTIAGIGIIFGIYKLVEKFVLAKMKSDGESQELSGPLEWFALVLVIFVAVAVRVIVIVASTGQMDGNGIYYSYGISGNAELFGGIYSNGSYIYGEFLRFVLGFLGHISTAAMALQAGLHSITIVVTYFMVKKALGRLPAWIGILLMSFLPGSFMTVKMCSPDVLFTLFFVIYMLILVSVCRANREQKIKIGAHSVFYMILAVISAFLAYYDVAGLMAVVISVVAFLQYRNEDAWMKIQKAWLQILIYALVFALVFVLLLWFLPLNGTEAGPGALIAYAQALIPNLNFNLMILTPHKGQWDSMALFIMAGLWFVGFLRTKEDKAFPYAFMIVVLTLTSFFGIGVYEYNVFSSFLWIMLATVGISTLSIFRKTQRDVEKAEKIKEDKINRKEERERKRAAAAGEKSIRLDEVHKKPVEEPVFEPKATNDRRTTSTSAYGTSSYNNASTAGTQDMPVNGSDVAKKSYGIGRKTDDSPVEQAKPVEIISHPTFSGANSVAEARIETTNTTNAAVVSSMETASSVMATRTVVRTVDKPPVATAPTPIPVESKPSYSQGSRSRRALRSPSKSTFTQEDLERISRYTGVNYSTPTYQSHADVIAETDNFVAYSVETATANPVAPETTATNENVVIQHDIPDLQPATTYIELDETTEVSLVENDVEMTPSHESVTDDAEKVGESTFESVESVTEEANKDNLMPSLPVMEFKPPVRRHFRHPSKSTFSAEELEKISQYTGMDYGKNSAIEPEETPDVENTPDELEKEQRAETSVIERDESIASNTTKSAGGSVGLSKEGNISPGHARDTVSKPTDSMENIKTKPERKPKMIRNPLPGPKPHVAKELNYDYNPKASEMEYDIVDLKGKDFFDI